MQLSIIIYIAYYPSHIFRVTYLGSGVEQVDGAVSEVPDLEVEPVHLTGEFDEVVVAGLIAEHIVLAVQLLLGCYACHF